MVRRKGNRNENRKSIALFSGIFFIAGICVLVLIGISLGKETYRKKQVQKEIESLQQEIEKINRENGELGNLISYLSTREFQEKEAREKLNLQKEDEKMIVLRKEIESRKTDSSESAAPQGETEAQNGPNWKKWLEYFFAAGK